MTKIAIIGGGRAATVHAEAVLALPGTELVGIGGRRPGTADALARAIGVADRPIDELLARADGVIVAVPPRAVPEVMREIPADYPVLVESPVGLDPTERPRAATAVNLLHATVVKRALDAIRNLGPVHHLVMRSRAPRPSWGTHGRAEFGGGVLYDPAAGALPVLLAAAGTPVAEVEATVVCEGKVVDVAAELAIRLADGRRIRADLAWVYGPGATEIEAAGSTGVVTVQLWPRPTLEINGQSAPAGDEPPLVALGFVEQMRRFAAVAAGRADPWPPRSVGDGVVRIAEAAARSSLANGAAVSCAGPATTDPATVFAEAD